MNRIQVNVSTEPFHFIEIFDLYTEKETNEMLDEMIFFQKKGAFLPPEQTASARNYEEGGKLMKSNSGLYMDALFQDRNNSSILTHNRKLFDILNSDTVASSWFFNKLHIRADYTLVSYYENADYYEPHRDSAVFTALTWFYKTPKMFRGGNLKFTDYDLTSHCRRNYTIVFPSNIWHEVSEVEMPEEFMGNSNGRFVMSQFGHSQSPDDA